MAKTLEVRETIDIGRPASMVRRQFADVAHHAATDVHRGVTFEVIAEDCDGCRYQQRTRVGPLRLSQLVYLAKSVDGPLVNTIEKGQFTNGSLSFTVQAKSETSAKVTAVLAASLSGPLRLLAPVLRANVGRALRRALEEDRADLESGGYADIA